MNQHVSLTFSLKYLVNFSKSSSLSNTVQLMMSNDVPLLVSVHELSVDRTFVYLVFSSSGEIQVRTRGHKILSSTKDWGRVNVGAWTSYSAYRVSLFTSTPYLTFLYLHVVCDFVVGSPELFYTKTLKAASI